jgi:hypothetical protein
MATILIPAGPYRGKWIQYQRRGRVIQVVCERCPAETTEPGWVVLRDDGSMGSPPAPASDAARQLRTDSDVVWSETVRTRPDAGVKGTVVWISTLPPGWATTRSTNSRKGRVGVPRPAGAA